MKERQIVRKSDKRRKKCRKERRKAERSKKI